MKVLVIDCERNVTSDREVGNPFKRQTYENYHMTYTIQNDIAYYIGEGDLSHQFKNADVLRGSHAGYALIQAQGVKL